MSHFTVLLDFFMHFSLMLKIVQRVDKNNLSNVTSNIVS